MPSVSGFLPSTHGLHFDNAFPHQADLCLKLGRRRIPIGDAANGLCGGMVYTVADLWQARIAPPPGTSPPAADSPLFTYLVRRLFDSFDLPGGPLTYLSLMNPARADHGTAMGAFGRSRAWRIANREWPHIKVDLDAGRLCPLGLVRVKSINPSALGKNHQVLAYGYERDGAALSLRVYDPNRHDDDSVRLLVDLGRAVDYTGGGRPVHCFFRTKYRFADPSAISRSESPQ